MGLFDWLFGGTGNKEHMGEGMRQMQPAATPNPGMGAGSGTPLQHSGSAPAMNTAKPPVGYLSPEEQPARPARTSGQPGGVTASGPSDSRNVDSPECTGCLNCLAACRHRGALELHAALVYQRINPWLFPALLVGTLLFAVFVAQVFGYWQDNLSHDEHAPLIPMARFLQH